MKTLVLGLLFAPLLALAGEDGLPDRDTLARLEQAGGPGFGTCAAYYFLAARGHPATDYDTLYTSGEFSLNSAILLHGRTDGPKPMEEASRVMMAEIDQDWRLIDRLDKHYAASCDALIRSAGYVPP